jgi:exopolysaccharide production protein ExoZ
LSFASDHTAQRWQFVEYLRGFAALAVACFHFEPHLNVVLGRAPDAPGIMNWFGFAGVDLFFVISGFVVWPVAWRHARFHARDSRSFLVRRLLRVYMPYWAVLLLVCGMGLVGASSNLPKSALLFPQPIPHQVLPVAWTLVLEIIFYTITFGCLLLPRQFRFAALCGITLVALAGNLLPVALGHIESTQTYRLWSWVPTVGWFGPVVLKYVLSLHLLEFAIGAGIAELARSGGLAKLARHRSAMWMIALAWLCGTLLASILLAQGRAATGTDIVLQRFALAAGAASLLFLAIVCTEVSLPAQRLPTRTGAVLAWLGGGSYMIYLLHNPMLEFAAARGLRDGCAALGATGAAVFALWFVAMIALAAWIGNRIELPFYRRVVALLAARRAPQRRTGSTA